MGHYVIQQDSYKSALQATSTVSMSAAYNGTKQAMFTPDGEIGTDAYAGSRSGSPMTYYVYESVFQFQTSAIPVGELATSATLRLYGITGVGKSGKVLEAYYDSSLTFPAVSTDYRTPTQLSTLYTNNLQVGSYDTWAGGTNSWQAAGPSGNSTTFNDFTPTANMNTVLNSLIPSSLPMSVVLATTKIRNADPAGEVSPGPVLTTPYLAGDTNGTNTKLIVDTVTAAYAVTTFMVRA